MVSGAGVGYPDWQRYSNWVGPPLVTQAAFNVLPATQTFGPFNVSQWESLLFSINNGGHPLKVVIDSTPRLSPFAVQQTFVLRANGQTQFVLPNRSDQVKVILSSALASAPSPDVVDMQINPCNLPEGVHATTDPGGMLAHGSQNVAGGATVNFPLPFYFGRVMFYFARAAQAFIYSVIMKDDAGTVLNNAGVDIPALTGIQKELLIPGIDCTLSVFNNSGVAAVVDVSVIADTP